MEKVTAKQARAMYVREWRRKNPDKVKAYEKARWERKAAKINAEIAAREAAEQEGGAVHDTDKDD